MVYSEKYNRWFSKEGLVYRLGKDGKLVLCKQHKSGNGYMYCSGGTKATKKPKRVHRLIWEAFNGEIPDGMEIDHINTNRCDNRLCNLQLCTRKENANNPITKARVSSILAARNAKGKGKCLSARSWFAKEYYAHFHVHFSENVKQYNRELMRFRRTGVLSWNGVSYG